MMHMKSCTISTVIRLRLRAHVYVFKKIRFQKDPFWGVHTYRMSIRRPRSHGRGLILGNVPPPENYGLCVLRLCWQRRTRLKLKSHFFSVSFACQCRSSVLLHVLMLRGRSARSLRIMQVGDKRKAPKAKWNTNKRRSKVKQEQNTRPSSKRTTR